jgi:hypothetical protein
MMAHHDRRPAKRIRGGLMIAVGAWLLFHGMRLTADEETKGLAKAWVQDRQREFQEYDLHREAVTPTGLTLEPQSVLNWSNPERGAANGALFLWTDRGRPQIIACAFEWNGQLNHEFQSLSPDVITAERLGQLIHRFGPGVEFKPLPEAPKPVVSRTLRLTQMRRMAERFRVTAGKSEVRLLPQPVFRSPESLADDVAMFVFVQGTDPECTLLLEATEKKEWRYALARQTKWGLTVELDQTLIWNASPTSKAKEDAPFKVFPQKDLPSGKR